MPSRSSALKRIGLLAVAWAAACNAITGVDDLEVREQEEACDDGAQCFRADCPSQMGVLRCPVGVGIGACECEVAAGSGGTANERPGGGGTGTGGSNSLASGGSGGLMGSGGAGMGGTSSMLCTPAEARDCRLPNGTQGIDVCSADGMSFGVCTALVATPRTIGIPCTQNAQCVRGLTCVTSSTPSGPQGGYCTRTCADDTNCQGIDPESYCYQESHYCLAACTTDAGEIDLEGEIESLEPPDLNLKCQGRPELACFPLSRLPSARAAEEGVCLPVCQSNADCGGRFCNLNTGGCDDVAPVGGDIGAPCTPATAAVDCASGYCQPLGPTRFFCTGACSQLEVGGCGFPANTPPGQRQAACVDSIRGLRYRDLGLCMELCDTPADCAQPGWQCSSLGRFTTQWGRAGFCVPPDVLCSNRCVESDGDTLPDSEAWAADGVCDDGGLDFDFEACTLGTDCADCGIRFPQQ
jgi:hypothetical protein